MKKGLIIIVASLASASLLVVVWLVALVAHVGGALVHLLLLAAILDVFIGVLAGVIVLAVNRGK